MNLIKEELLKWCDKHTEEEMNKPYLSNRSRNFTLAQLREEIVNDTKVGKDMQKNLVNLTLDLLTRNKIDKQL